MSESENLEIEFKGLATLLLDGKLKVPEYQRIYAWSEKQVGLQNEKERALIPNSHAKEITLEHIIPRRPSKNWPMEPKLRSSLVKRIVFKASELKITSGLGDLTSFAQTEIDKRQSMFAEVATKAWRVYYGEKTDRY